MKLWTQILCFSIIALTMIVMGNCTPAYAQTKKSNWNFELTNETYSKRLVRGFVYSNGTPVLQHSATFTYKGIGVGVWANFNFNPEVGTFDEVDFYVSYSRKVHKWWSLKFSYVAMYLPFEDGQQTQELSARVTFDHYIQISLLTLYDWVIGSGTYTELSLSRTVMLDKHLGLSMKTALAYNYKYIWNEQGLSHALFEVGLPINFCKHWTLTPKVGYSLGLQDALDDNGNKFFQSELYFGISLNFWVDSY